MDFDDLLGQALRLLREHPDVLQHYQRRFKHILVDEYQDTNRVQNDLVLLLAADHRNVCVVGDQDQCLPPGTAVATPVRTAADRVDRGGRRGTRRGRAGRRPITSHVTTARAGHYRGRLYTVHAGGRSLRGTPHHVVLADPALEPDRHVVYLMERIDRGFRIGLTKSMRPVAAGRLEQGLRVRINQEHADRAWILRVCEGRAEAAYWEAFYAAEYGLPTALFHGLGRNLAFDEGQLARLFDQIDTRSRAKQLMEDLDLHPAFPHYTPANGGRRQTLNLTMFSDCRHGDVGYHRVQWSSNRTAVAERLTAAGFPVRAGKPGSYRVETSFKDYRRALRVRQGDGGGRRARHPPAGRGRRDRLPVHAARAPP